MANKKIKNPIIREQLSRSGKNFKGTKSKPVKKDVKTIMSEINPRTREELEKRRKRKSKLGGPAGGIKKKDDADKLASFHKAKFFTGPTETAKDKINPMKAQRLFMDSTKFRQKSAAKKAYETGVDKAGNKMSDTKTANYFRKNSDKDSVKKATEDFFKPFDQKRMFNKGGKVKLALKGGGRAFGKNS